VSGAYVAEAVRRRVAEAAARRCGYCQTQEEIVGYTLHIEHILPLAAGGTSNEENLWLACFVCNNAKGTQTRGLDPETGAEVLLFNPRTQSWGEHFAWSTDGTEVVGTSPVGRATALALQLNTPLRCEARRRWVAVGWHPPTSRPSAGL
jgi:hypothetical protein